MYSFIHTLTASAISYPDSKVHGANMGPAWVLSAPDGPHVGPMNLGRFVHVFLLSQLISPNKVDDAIILHILSGVFILEFYNHGMLSDCLV